MSLDYGYIFSQIDKAKKKKKKLRPVDSKTGRRADGSIPWNSKLGIENRERIERERIEREKEIERTGGRVSQRMYKRPKDRKPGEKPGTYREGYNTPFKDEKDQVVGGQASNVGTTRRAHSSAKLTDAERKKRIDAKARVRKLPPKERKAVKRRSNVSISDLEEGGTGNIDREQAERAKRRNISAEKNRLAVEEAKRLAASTGYMNPKEKPKPKKTDEKVTEGVRSTTYNQPTIRSKERDEAKILFEAAEAKRKKREESLRRQGGKKPGIDLPPEKKKRKRKPKETKESTEESEGPGGDVYDPDDYVVDYSEDDDEGRTEGYGSTEKSLWKAWFRGRGGKKGTKDEGSNPVGGKPAKTQQAIAAQVKQTLRDRKERQEAHYKERFRKNPKGDPPYPKVIPGETMSQYNQRQEQRADDIKEERYNTTLDALESIKERNEKIISGRDRKAAQAASKPKQGTSSSYAPKGAKAKKPKGAKAKKPKVSKPEPVTEKPTSVSTPKPDPKKEEPRLNRNHLDELLEQKEQKKKEPPKSEFPKTKPKEEHTVTFADAEKSLWKSWLEKKEDFDQKERDSEGKKREAEKEKEKYKLREFTDWEKKYAPWRLEPPYLDSDYAGGKKPPTPTDRMQNMLLDTMAEDKEDKDPPKGVKKPHSEHTIKPSDKAEEGIGGMNMGSQRGLGHEAGYKQDPGQTAQITEVKDKIDKIKAQRDEDEEEEGEQSKQRERTRSGQQDAAETQSYTYGDSEHLYDEVRAGMHGHPKHVGDSPGQPKERDVPLSRVEGTSGIPNELPGLRATVGTKDGKEREVTVSQLGERLGLRQYGRHAKRALRDTRSGKLGQPGTSKRSRLVDERERKAENSAVQTALAATISAEEAELGKSAYQTDQQDESSDSQPNKQQIPVSKPGMDALKMYKKSLIIKYNNIYKPANI